MTKLERNFTIAMMDLYREIISSTRGAYKPTGLLALVDEYGGLVAARNLIRRSSPSDGYSELHGRGLLNLTAEALVLQPQWAELFDRDDLIAAYHRLSQYEFDFPPDYWRPNS